MLAIKTSDAEMGNATATWGDYSYEELATYLNESPRNAVVVTTLRCETAVFRGAGEDLNNFYVQDLPLEDPGDAEGGSWTAQEALVYVKELEWE